MSTMKILNSELLSPAQFDVLRLSQCICIRESITTFDEEKDYRRNLHKFIGKCHLACVQV